MEIVNVVDKNNQVQGELDKDICHKEGKWHRIAATIILNDKGEI